MRYPYNLTKEEAIRRIQEVYHAQYDPTREYFNVYDQLLACEAIAETIPEYETVTRKNGYVSGNDNGTYKRGVNAESNQRKLEVITELNKCTYKTPPIKIAKLLEELFKNTPSKEGHWLFVAQHWPPRAINRVINQMIKQHKTGVTSIKNSSAYFSYLIKYRAKRKFTGTNGGRRRGEQHELK